MVHGAPVEPHCEMMSNPHIIQCHTCGERARSAFLYSSVWVYLLALGIIASTTALLAAAASGFLVRLRVDLAERFGMAAWIGSSAIGVLLACLITVSSPGCDGSGIPRMYAIMSGYAVPKSLVNFLSLRTLVVKLLGLVLAVGGGLVIGKEGPLVAICCVIAQLLMHWVFPHLETSRELHQQALAAACALGVSSSLGAPLGGVLFAIEVTSSFYHFSSRFWKGFFVAVVGAFHVANVTRLWNSLSVFQSLFHTSFDSLSFHSWELGLFCLLGALCGAVGGLWVKTTLAMGRALRYAHWAHCRRRCCCNAPFDSARVQCLLAIGVATAIAALEYPLGGAGCRDVSGHLSHVKPDATRSLLPGALVPGSVPGWGGHIGVGAGGRVRAARGLGLFAAPLSWVVHDLFADSSLDDASSPAFHGLHCHDFASGEGLRSNLAWWALLKFVASALCACLCIPRGMFLPVFAVGAALGRLAAELLVMHGHPVVRGGYAVVGGAAAVAGATGTVSAAVITFEVTSQLSYLLPVLLAVLVGRTTGRLCSIPIFQALATKAGLQRDPMMTQEALLEMTVADVMRREQGEGKRGAGATPGAPGSVGKEEESDFSAAVFAPRFATRATLWRTVARAQRARLKHLAVVESESNRLYCGVVAVAAVERIARDETFWGEGGVALGDSGDGDPGDDANAAWAGMDTRRRLSSRRRSVLNSDAKAIDLVLDAAIALRQFGTQVPAELSLSDLCFFCAAHRVSQAFVTEKQRVVGVVYLADMPA